MEQKYIQSPLNYTGGKFKLLKQIIPLFPKNIGTFVDLFGGGFNVGANINAEKIVYNEFDINVYKIVKGIYESEDDMVSVIDGIISKYSLSKTNKEGYLSLREDWNNSLEKDWYGLYTLICHSFNHSIRFNSKGFFNIAFGENRSEFNIKLRQKLIEFKNLIKSKEIYFYNKSFEVLTKSSNIKPTSFFYADPPYLITTANYNENGGWSEDMEYSLLNELDRLNSKGVKFALSNVLEHKGKSNDILKEWAKKYKVHYLTYNYNNCNYQGKGKEFPTIEVLITNY